MNKFLILAMCAHAFVPSDSYIVGKMVKKRDEKIAKATFRVDIARGDKHFDSLVVTEHMDYKKMLSTLVIKNSKGERRMTRPFSKIGAIHRFVLATSVADVTDALEQLGCILAQEEAQVVKTPQVMKVVQSPGTSQGVLKRVDGRIAYALCDRLFVEKDTFLPVALDGIVGSYKVHATFSGSMMTNIVINDSWTVSLVSASNMPPIEGELSIPSELEPLLTLLF